MNLERLSGAALVRPRQRARLVPMGVIVLVASEIFLIAIALMTAFFALKSDAVVFFGDEDGFWRMAFLTATILFGMHLSDLYSQVRIKSRVQLILQIMQAMGLACLGQAIISYADVDLLMPRPLVFLGTALAALAILVWRFLYSNYLLRLMGTQRVLFVGETPLVREIAAHLEDHPQLGLTVVGYVDDTYPVFRQMERMTVGPAARLKEIVNRAHPDCIVVDESTCHGGFVTEILALRAAGYDVEEAALTYEHVCKRVYLSESHTREILAWQLHQPVESRLHRWSLWLVAAAALVISAPLVALIALLVRLSSPGPILYRQTRTGLNNERFTIYKFRSMRVDAEKGTGPVWAAPQDPRTTPLGRLLRKLRLDELPQLFNVLRGDMSLVGPRPERPEFVQSLSERIPYYAHRHRVKPGITGWAQINYKYGDAFEDVTAKLQYDLYYLKHRSFSLELYILFQTVKTILLTRGAQ